MTATRRERLTALAAAYLLIAAGLTWLLGGLGLVTSGLVLFALVFFAIDVEETSADTVPEAARPQAQHRRSPV